MYEPHYIFKLPENPEKTKVWRYLDLWKFLNLLETSSLYFCRVDKLGDQHEGRIPEKILQGVIDYYENSGNKITADNFRGFPEFLDKELRPTHLVNCWTISEHESFALWKLYSKDRFGVAIQTTVQNLIEAINVSNEKIYVGIVQYYNDIQNNESLQSFDLRRNSFFTFLNKHIFYRYEEEIRMIHVIQKKIETNGIQIKVDVNTLLENIYLAPFASKESEKLMHLLKKEYNLSFNINKSQVSDSWM